MKGPALLTMLMFVSVAVLALSANQPRAGQRDSAGWLGRTSAKPACPPGLRYSSFYKSCIHGYTQAAYR